MPNVTRLVHDVLRMELDLALLRTHASLFGSGEDEIRSALLPMLEERWSTVETLGPIQILSIRTHIESLLERWQDEHQTLARPGSAMIPKPRLLRRFWHCVRRWASV